MKLTDTQFNTIAQVRPELKTITLDGTNDYSLIADIIGKPMLKALAVKTGEAQNNIVWAFKHHIKEQEELDTVDTEALAGF